MAAPRKNASTNVDTTNEQFADVHEEVKIETNQKQVKKAVKLDKSMLVEVKNNTAGVLVIPTSREGITYVLNNFGDVEDIELGDLQMIKNRYPRFFQDAWITVEDPDVIDYLKIGRFYKNAMTEDDIEEFFDSDVYTMEEILDGASPQNKALILGIARKRIASGELDSAQKIKLLEQKFEVQLIG